MKVLNLLFRFAVLGVCITSSASTANADTAYGNLGADEGGSLGDNYAQRDFFNLGAFQQFQTGSSTAFLTLESIRLGLSEDNPAGVSRTVGVYQSGTGPNPSTPVLLATSNPTLVLGKGVYEFSFNPETPVTLAASTTYWISPAFGSSSRWYMNTAETAPTAFNDSGYGFLGAGRYNTMFWPTNSSDQGLSLSINAVPEPSTSAMALAGLGLTSCWIWRRYTRKKKKVPATNRTVVAKLRLWTAQVPAGE